MRRVIWLLAVGAIVVAAAWWLAELPGMVSLGIGDLVIETRAGVAVMGGAVALFILIAILRVLLGILAIPKRIRTWRAGRKRNRGDVAVTRALVALAAADGNAARREASRAREALGDSGQTLLLAAEAERLAGREGEAETIYRLMAGREDAAFLGLRGLFRQAMAREDWAGAAEIARKAEAAHPGALWLREERTALAVRAGDWTQALALAGPGTTRVAYATAAAEAIVDADRGLAMAKRAWKDDRSFVPAALAYATRLRAAGKESKAQSVLADTWTLSPHPELAKLALTPLNEPLARIAATKRLTAGAAEHSETHLLLARESLNANLPGEAHRHAEAARTAGLTQTRLYLLLADIAAAEHKPDAQRDALRLAASAEPDPAWRCDACGAAHDTWHAACPACHAPGQIQWSGPKRPLLTAP